MHSNSEALAPLAAILIVVVLMQGTVQIASQSRSNYENMQSSKLGVDHSTRAVK
jgi:hypothetical protein